MNLSEARHAQTLMNWILGLPGPDGEPVSEHAAMRAVDSLGTRSFKTLGHGITGVRACEEWMRRRPIVVHECPDV